ncbi:hypothetical protein CLV43_110110 [Umezawaea tangerina]|uniref:Secreted protein n=2 Tax=Umezawaea tangerina TaxID=84725 RepID=A0A2T0SV62_9PSEU|nr:hypothetical protein CLV43_110110 [Umezawaea tangerina]
MRRALVVTALCAAGAGTVFAVTGSATASPTPGSGFSNVKCTDQADYAGDARSAAEINSVGFATGTCPVPRPYTEGVKCTDQIDYAGDHRSNAEINSLGSVSGSCPVPES